MSKTTPNSRLLFLATLKAELGVTAMNGNKVISSINKDQSKIALFEDILNNNVKVSDMQIHSIRHWIPDTNLFEQDDAIKLGIRNISESMLKKSEFFVPVGIIIMVGPVLDANGTATPYTDADALNVNFKPVGEVAAAAPLKQAEWFIRHDQKYVVPEHSTAQVFDTNDTDVKGMYLLDTPRFFDELKRIEVNLKTSGKIPDNYAVKCVLVGAGTLPN